MLRANNAAEAMAYEQRRLTEDTLTRASGLCEPAANALRLAYQCKRWCTQLLTISFPPANRLAYVFRPATADTVTLVLLGCVLLPFFHVPLLPCLILVLLMCHVGATWLGHIHNLSKLGIMDKLGASLAAQQQLLMAKQASLQQGMEAVAHLQSRIASLEQQAQQVQQLEDQHSQLMAKASRMEALQEQISAGQRAVAHLPRMQTRLVQLQGRRRLMEKLRWAVQVLKSETAKAGTIQEEYARLKAARADMQATKQALQAETQQLRALEEEVAVLEQQATCTRQLKAQVDALKENKPLAALDTNSQASHGSRQAANSGAAKADMHRSLDSLPMRALMGSPVSTTLSTGPTDPTLKPTAAPTFGAMPGARGLARPSASGLSSSASVGSHASGMGAVRRRVVLDTPAGSQVFQVVDNEAFYTPMVPAELMTPPGAFTPGPEAAALAAALSSGVMPLPTRSRSSTISKPLWGISREVSSVPVVEEGREEEEDDAIYPMKVGDQGVTGVQGDAWPSGQAWLQQPQQSSEASFSLR